MAKITTFDEAYVLADTVTGYFRAEEADILWRAAMTMPEHSRWVEIGADQGRSTTLLAQAARERSAAFYSVDPFVNPASRTAFAETMARTGLGPLVRHLDMTSAEAARLMQAVDIDLLFVDGCHEPESVWLDCQLWLPQLKKGGIAVFHDYGPLSSFPGVTKAVDWYTAGWQEFGFEHLCIAKVKP